MILMLIGFAIAEDPKILPVAEGSSVTLYGDVNTSSVVQVTTQSYLLPEKKYKRCLAVAENYPVCEKALGECQDMADMALGQVDKALGLCSSQFDEDEALVQDLTQKVSTLEAQNLTLEMRLQDVKQQRNIAWAITSGLVVGAVTMTAVAIGN